MSGRSVRRAAQPGGRLLPAATRLLCVGLLTLTCVGSALAQNPPATGPPPDASRLIMVAPRYSPVQKAMLNGELAQARAARVPADTLYRLTAMSLARAVPAENLAGFYQVLRRVYAAGLPVSAFENKIAEGLVKGAPPELIQQVVLERERNYHQARQLLMRNVKRQLLYDQAYYRTLDLGAEGLRRGLPPDGLVRIYRTPNHTLEEMARAVRAYLYMQAIGFPLDAGLDIAVAALESGQFRECYSCLGQVIFTAKRSGAAPQRIRDELVAGMRNGRQLREIGQTLYAPPR